MRFGRERLSGYFVVGPTPYSLVLGFGWLTHHKLAWNFQSERWGTYVNGRWCELSMMRASGGENVKVRLAEERKRTPVEQASDLPARHVAGMTLEGAAPHLRPH